MFIALFLAALAALPIIAAQSTSTTVATSTACFTRYGFHALPTGAATPTWYSFTATTQTIQVSLTSHSTVTVTPSATHFVNMTTVSTTTTTTVTSQSSTITVSAPSNFVPLLLVNVAAPTTGPVISRIKRLELEGRSDSTPPLRRQTAPNNTGGFIAFPNGTYSGLYRRHPQRVNCTITVQYDETVTTVVEGDPVTRFAQQQTVTDVSTATSTFTSTVTAEVPGETIYAACAVNNVVNRIADVNGSTMYFDRIVYRPAEGFPVANEMIMFAPDPVSCCVQCQKTAFCAGSFYAPAIGECHLRLTQPYMQTTPAVARLPARRDLPSGIFTALAEPPLQTGISPAPTGVFPASGVPSGIFTAYNGSLILATGTAVDTPYPIGTGTGVGAPYPISTGTAPGGNTCAAGSMSLYLGPIRGQERFPEDVAIYVSNGPCGRFSVNPVPLGPNEIYKRLI